MPAADLKETLNKIATEAVPDVPRLDDAVLPARVPGSRGRPGLKRTVDEAALRAEVSQYLTGTVNPIHDALLMGFQKLFDNLAGDACPHLVNNQNLVENLNVLARCYGFQMFGVQDDTLLRVTLAARAGPAASRLNPQAPSALAGVFVLSFYDEAGGRPVTTTNVAALPELIVARDLDQAKAIQKQRAKPE